MKRKLGVLFLGVITAAVGQRKEMEPAVMRAARGTKAAVAAGSEYATEAGMRMYYHGGNAVDAGVATMFAASASEFSHFGMGGEAPILIRTKAGKVFAIAGVGTMPKLATAEMFRQRRPKAGEILELEPGGLKGIIPVAGIMPVLVPGMVESGLVALREFGTKSFAEVIEPAIELADNLAIDEMRSTSIARSRIFFERWPDSKRVFLPNGQVPMPGEIFHQPDLARTLRGMVAAERRLWRAAGIARRESMRFATIFIGGTSHIESTRLCAPMTDCCVTRTWPHSSCSPKSRYRRSITVTEFTSRAFGARVRRCLKR